MLEEWPNVVHSLRECKNPTRSEWAHWGKPHRSGASKIPRNFERTSGEPAAVAKVAFFLAHGRTCRYTCDGFCNNLKSGAFHGFK